MVEVFVDTSAWYALRVVNDANHARARGILESLAARRARLHTSDWVIVETLSLISRRVSPAEAVRAGEWILASPAVEVHPLGDALREAYDEFQALAGKVSLVDCGSFAVMRGSDLKTAFAFDSDFQARGFSAAI